MKASWGIVSTLVGVSLLLAAWIIYEPPAADIGDIPAAQSQEPAPSPDPDPEPFELPDTEEQLFPEESEAVTTHVRFDHMPSMLRVPAIDVDHPLIPVGLNPDGSMEIPHDVHEIGWYEPQGVLPGDDGTAVLAGHVDSRSQGPGAFYDLRHLEIGDEILISDSDSDQRWEVVARRTYDKNEIPIEEIFVDHGDPRLVLVTCGGEFDRTRRSYTDNIVVYAEPA